MKNFLTTLLFLTALGAHAQKSKKAALHFDIKDFTEKQKLAEWLNEYDQVAWHTSDSVMAQPAKRKMLDGSWFCFQDESQTWHALYGNYTGRRFTPAYHYLMQDNVISSTTQAIDTARCNSYARALKLVNAIITPLRDSTHISMNQFVRSNADGTVSVWILPAYQSNNVAVYGGEFSYILNSTGSKILSRNEYFQGQFRGFKTDRPREIWLDYHDVKKPTLGGIFFVTYYRRYFTNIFIDTSESKSTLFKNEQGQYYWVNVEKEPQQSKTRKQKID